MNYWKHSILKLSSGDTVMAEVARHDEEKNVYYLNNPITISQDEDPDTRRAVIYSYPYIPLMEEDNMVEINGFHIVSASKANSDMVAYYHDSLSQLMIGGYDRTNSLMDQLEKKDELKKEFTKELLKLANTSIH